MELAGAIKRWGGEDRVAGERAVGVTGGVVVDWFKRWDPKMGSWAKFWGGRVKEWKSGVISSGARDGDLNAADCSIRPPVAH